MATSELLTELEDRARVINEHGGFESSAQYQDFLQMLRDALSAYEAALQELGDADYDGLQGEHIECRRWGHEWSRPRMQTGNVAGGFGRCYERYCDRCGMHKLQWVAWNGAPNGTKTTPPPGYSLKTGNGRPVPRRIVHTIEGVLYELPAILAQMEADLGLVSEDAARLARRQIRAVA